MYRARTSPPILAQWLLGTYTLRGGRFVGFMSHLSGRRRLSLPHCNPIQVSASDRVNVDAFMISLKRSRYPGVLSSTSKREAGIKKFGMRHYVCLELGSNLEGICDSAQEKKRKARLQRRQQKFYPSLLYHFGYSRSSTRPSCPWHTKTLLVRYQVPIKAPLRTASYRRKATIEQVPSTYTSFLGVGPTVLCAHLWQVRSPIVPLDIFLHTHCRQCLIRLRHSQPIEKFPAGQQWEMPLVPRGTTSGRRHWTMLVAAQSAPPSSVLFNRCSLSFFCSSYTPPLCPHDDHHHPPRKSRHDISQ